MTDLPRRPIGPLQPPPGSFELTVARARSRRRRALVGASSAGLAVAAVVAIAGATSLAHVGAQRDVHPVLPIASSPPPSSAPPSSAPPSSALPSTTASAVVSPPVPPRPVVVSSPPPSAPVSVAPAIYRGRLTDAAHHPLKGYRVYWEKHVVGADGTSDTIDVDHPAAVTRADGSFTASCPAAGMSLVIPPQPLLHGAQALVYDKGAEKLSIMQVGDLMVARMIDPGAGCRPGAATTTTVFQPHAVVTGTYFFGGKRYDAAMAASAAAAQPGDTSEVATLFVEIPAPSGTIEMDGLLPDPATGTFTISGLGSGEVVFLFYNSRATVPVVDGQQLRIEVRATPGTAPDASDATVAVAVVP